MIETTPPAEYDVIIPPTPPNRDGMRKRPPVVTVAATILLLLGAFLGLVGVVSLGTFLMADSLLPKLALKIKPAYGVMAVSYSLGSVAFIFNSIGLLKLARWARHWAIITVSLFMALSFASFSYMSLLSAISVRHAIYTMRSPMLLPLLAICVILIFLLSLPAVKAAFPPNIAHSDDVL